MASTSTLTQIQQALKQAQAVASSLKPLGKRTADQSISQEQPIKSRRSMENAVDDRGESRGSATAPPGPIVEQLEVPDKAVGMIIGRGGETITNMQAVSGCRVQLVPGVSEAGMRKCELQGPRGAVERARAMIAEVVQQASVRPPLGKRRGDGPDAAAQMDGGGGGGREVTVELLVPGNKCGLIIGKGGETIKQIQDRAGVKIVLIQESHDVTAQPKPLRISGDADSVAFAKALCEDVLNWTADAPPSRRAPLAERFDYNAAEPTSIGEVIVPRCAVGTIIGRGGETVKHLSAASGARIQFNRGESQEALERTAVLQGTPNQIQRATAMISELVTQAMQMGDGRGGVRECIVHVPAARAGLVIGRGGETIGQLCRESGADIQASRDASGADRLFTIRGSASQIERAQLLIRAQVDDAFDALDVVSEQHCSGESTGAFDQHNHGGYTGCGGGGGALQNVGPSDGTTAQGSSYCFAAQQQQQQQQFTGGYYGSFAASAVQPTAAAVNSAPTAGANYFAQWADYYRAVGMPDLAAQMLQQAGHAPAAVDPATYGYCGRPPMYCQSNAVTQNQYSQYQ